MAKISSHPTKFDSISSVTGLDFMARSLVIMEANGTELNPLEVAANMTDEQKEIFMARLQFHRNRQRQCLISSFSNREQ